MKPEDRKRLKQHIEMIVEHKKTPIEYFQNENRRLRIELQALRFKESQEQRFIWWIWNVYARNVHELLLELEKTTFPVTPFGMSALVKHIKEGTGHIYDGTYLDVEVSMENKTVPENKTSPDNNKQSDIDVSVT